MSLHICLAVLALLISASVSFALPDCPSDQTKRYHNCFGPYNFPDGEKYVGEWKDNEKNGIGTYTFPDGEKFVGEYKNDERNGLGTNTFADGDKFVGEYKNDERNGLGTYTFGPDSEFAGDKMVNEYKDNKENGKGFYIWGDGKADFCDYVDSEDSNCFGSSVYDVAPILTAKFRQLPESQRKQIQSNLKSMDLYPSTIDGKWGLSTFSGIASYAALNLKTVAINNSSTANTLLQKIMGADSPDNGKCPADKAAVWDNCIGEITHFDGGKYVGQWKANKQNGQGTTTFANGDKYVGGFKDGKKNGQGTYTYSNGDKYIGEYKDDKPNGKGTFTFADGENYVGEYEDGEYNGQGIYTYANGENYVGGFINGDYYGQGTYTYANGDKYVGEYKDDEKHGQGTYTFANGNKYVGEYKDGKRNGQGTYTFADGTIEEGIWKDNEFQYARKNPNASVPSLAADCSTDPKECTPKKLCEMATNIKGGNTVWSTASGSANYVRFAQGLGMSCGVVAIVDPCDLDPNECKISQLCKKATKSNGEQTIWNSAAQGHVDVAKEYGLTCGVKTETTSASKICSESTPEECSNTYICNAATFSTVNSRAWKKGFQAYVKEAKKRGLSCGVTTQTTSGLPNCKGSYNASTWTNCFGTLTFANGEKYVGEYKDGKNNGQGTYTYPDGRKYVGEWKDSKKNGQGTFTFLDGRKYVGEWKDGKNNGLGAFTYANGDQYIGNYLDNARHGRGTQTYANGSKYVGEWRDDKRNGQGTFKLKSVLMDDIIQEGLWKDDVFQGENELKIVATNELGQTLCPGSPYDISQKPDVSKDWNACLGEVHWEYSGGGSYVGEFENGAWHGQGTFKQSPNEEYVGEWQNNQPHGQGTYTYADGTINEGKWENGEFQN